MSPLACLLLALLAAPGTHPSAPAPGFVPIRPGTFVMGSPPEEPGRFGDETQHRVTLTRPFDLCDHLVTQAEWQAVMHWNASLEGRGTPGTGGACPGQGGVNTR